MAFFFVAVLLSCDGAGCMHLDTLMLQKYVGGQIEIQEGGHSLVRGEICEIFVQGTMLRVRMSWAVRCLEHPRPCRTWVQHRHRVRQFNLEAYEARDIGPIEKGGGDRLYLQSSLRSVVVTMYPPGGCGLMSRPVMTSSRSSLS